ncbi:MAG: hypothetical protein H0V88_14345 [Pyrinomonadaceae bacterium]|nr:hypothetical protein [Pyrinomonadaceae bacterium]
MTKQKELLPNNSNEKTASRRRFAKTLTAAIVSAPLAAQIAGAQTRNPTPKEPAAPPNPQPSPAQNAPKPSPLAEAYAEVARVRFGERLTDEEFARVKDDLAGNVRVAERLRAFKLKNADEPDFVFFA